MTRTLRVVAACVAGLSLVQSSRGDWIDPDTPWEARTTEPLNVKPPPTYPIGGDWDGYVGGDSGTGSPAPSTSHEPSPAPTYNPTQYPTMTPRTFELVFSDEFNTPGRNFADGSDPRWTALEKNDYINNALHYYSASSARTENGTLIISSTAEDTEIVGFNDKKQEKEHVTRHFKSAMLQSWNKFCFTGGIIEAEIQLPGKHNIAGLWPAFWLLGNLVRHTYAGSSEHMWPWSAPECTEKSFHAQRISGCSQVAHYGLEAHVGRGAPEMDIFEVQAGPLPAGYRAFVKSPVGQPFMSNSFQVAPGRPSNRPGPGEWPGPDQWYEGLVGGANTSLNILFYGNFNSFYGDPDPTKSEYWSDAISLNRQLTENHFNSTHKYRLEWDVPTEDKPGYLHWFLDGELVFALNGTTIDDAGLGSEISTEPSYILLNTAISKQWGFPRECPTNCPCKEYDCYNDDWSVQCGFPWGFCDMMTDKEDPVEYKVNWIRVYQDPNAPEQKVGCSTPERPTRRYIEAHADKYKTEYDAAPLKPIQTGGGSCNAKAGTVCGGMERGHCTINNICECKPGWTGPQCLAHNAWDPISYDQPDSLSDVGFVPPSFFPKALSVGFFFLGVLLVVALVRKRRGLRSELYENLKYSRLRPTHTTV